MPAYTWSPLQFYPDDWNTPSEWVPMSVPNAPDADVVISGATESGVTPLTIENTESYIVRSLTLVDDAGLSVNGTLSVVGELTMGAGSVLDLAGSLAVGSLSNTGEIGPEGFVEGYISGSGQISSLGTIENRGAILSGNSPLTLDFAGLQNAGVLQAEGYMKIDVGSGPEAFTNLPSGTLYVSSGTLEVDASDTADGFLSSGTLSGGTYDAGNGVIKLNGGGGITTDAATIIESGGLLETEVNGVEHPLAETLRRSPQPAH